MARINIGIFYKLSLFPIDTLENGRYNTYMKNITLYDANGNEHTAIERIDDGGALLIFRLDDGQWMTKSKFLLRGKVWATEREAYQSRDRDEKVTVEHCAKWGSE